MDILEERFKGGIAASFRPGVCHLEISGSDRHPWMRRRDPEAFDQDRFVTPRAIRGQLLLADLSLLM
jgi:hypothetical protein